MQQKVHELTVDQIVGNAAHQSRLLKPDKIKRDDQVEGVLG